MKNFSAVIVANGKFPSHDIPLSIIKNAPYLVCCDGAANKVIARNFLPNAIVGDGDSVSDENKVRFADIFHQYDEQETNDLTKSVRFCLENGKTNIAIVGATGEREDHALGNISLLADYHCICQVKMITDYGVFTPLSGKKIFESFKGEKVSLFSMEPKPITTIGLKYPINNRILTNWWQGTLNESEGDEFCVEASGKVIVFQRYKTDLSGS